MISGSLDDHAVPTRSKLTFAFNGRMIGLGLPMQQFAGTPSSRRSMPPSPRPEMDALLKRQRKTSLKKILKQSGEMLSNVVGGQRYSMDTARPTFLASVGRMGSKTSTSSGEDTWHTPLPPTSEASASSSIFRPSDNSSWHEEKADGDIEKRVLEMAGLGIGLAPSTSSIKRRFKSEGVAKVEAETSMARSRSANNDSASTPKEAEIPDMRMLRRIADLPGNSRCADCDKGMQSSRWATLSELFHFTTSLSVDF